MHQPDTFFVYGTLRPGQYNFDVVDHLTVRTQPATVAGVELLHKRPLPFPYARLHPTAVTVGDLLQFPDRDELADAIQRLDALEGYFPDDPTRSHYLRERIEARTEHGELVEAWIYVAAHPSTLVGAQPIPSGDWLGR